MVVKSLFTVRQEEVVLLQFVFAVKSAVSFQCRQSSIFNVCRLDVLTTMVLEESIQTTEEAKTSHNA